MAGQIMKQFYSWCSVDRHELEALFSMEKCKLTLGEYGALSIYCGEAANVSLCTQKTWPFVLGSYRSAWRIVAGSTMVIIDGKDSMESPKDRYDRLYALNIGKIKAVCNNEIGDVRVHTTTDLTIEFFRTYPWDDDECFHIFMPGNLVAVLCENGWSISRSDIP